MARNGKMNHYIRQALKGLDDPNAMSAAAVAEVAANLASHDGLTISVNPQYVSNERARLRKILETRTITREAIEAWESGRDPRGVKEPLKVTASFEVPEEGWETVARVCADNALVSFADIRAIRDLATRYTRDEIEQMLAFVA